MFRHFSIAELPSDWMVSPVNGAAFRNEITLFVQLGSVFLQEPLDRARAGFVRADMDIADALRHPGSIVFPSISEP